MNPRNKISGLELISRLLILFSPLVVGVILLWRHPLYLAIFQAICIGFLLMLFSRCQHCGSWAYTGLGTQPLGKCAKCRRPIRR